MGCQLLFRKRKQGHEFFEKYLFPIDDTEKAISRLARSFPAAKRYRLEVFGYLIGLAKDRLTHLVIPEYVIGVKNDNENEMKNIRDTNSRTPVMLAANEDTGELGILILASPKRIKHRFLKGKFTFIPSDLLILNRPIIEFVPTERRTQLFPRLKTRKKIERHIVNVIKMSKDKRRVSLQNEKERWISICFLPEPFLKVDAFVSAKRIYPLNNFLLKTLTMNKFRRQRRGYDKACYGRVHVHYGYDFREKVSDPLIRALHRMDKKFIQLMTPVDAVSMIDSGRAVQEISENRLQAEQILEGVIALDPKSLDVIGASYFDMGIFKEDIEVGAFIEMAGESYNSRDIDVNKDWFRYVRATSKPHRPGYASS